MATQADPDPTGDDPHTGPLRRCLVTRQSLPRETMLRFVVGPQGDAVFDAPATLPGRGMWLSARGDVIELAVKRGVFARSAKRLVRIQPALRLFVEAALTQRVVDLLGLARRSGAAVSGFEKAQSWLVSGQAGLVVQAVDGSADERARFMQRRDVAVVMPLPAARLGQVFGREHAVHAAIAKGRLARMIEIEAARLAGVAGVETSGHTAQQR